MNELSAPKVALTLSLLVLFLATATFAAGQPTSTVTAVSFNQSYPGVILASDQAQLAFRVAGPLVKVAVKPGDRVKKGQLLMQIDPRDYKDNIRVLEAQLAGAVAEENRTRRDYERARTLFEQKVNATADFDRARSTFEGSSSGVESIKAQLEIARHQLKDSSLRAPYAGVITSQSVENFEMVNAGQVVMGLQDIATLEVEIKIPENEVAHRPLQAGTTVEVELSAIPGQSFSAELVEWNSSADPITRTYALRFAFKAPQDIQVLPGMTAEVNISKDEEQATTYLVPELNKLNTDDLL